MGDAGFNFDAFLEQVKRDLILNKEIEKVRLYSLYKGEARDFFEKKIDSAFQVQKTYFENINKFSLFSYDELLFHIKKILLIYSDGIVDPILKNKIIISYLDLIFTLPKISKLSLEEVKVISGTYSYFKKDMAYKGALLLSHSDILPFLNKENETLINKITKTNALLRNIDILSYEEGRQDIIDEAISFLFKHNIKTETEKSLFNLYSNKYADISYFNEMKLICESCRKFWFLPKLPFFTEDEKIDLDNLFNEKLNHIKIVFSKREVRKFKGEIEIFNIKHFKYNDKKALDKHSVGYPNLCPKCRKRHFDIIKGKDDIQDFIERLKEFFKEEGPEKKK